MGEVYHTPSSDPDMLTSAQSEGPGSAISTLREIAQTILIALVVFAIARLAVQNYRIQGPCMQPTLVDGQLLVINKLAYRLGELQRGDIIVFHYPNAPERDLIKRVIGLPGERLEIVRGQVWINSQPLDEPYVAERGSDSYALTTIETDHVFVMGDNRNDSNDSRRWGALPMRNIVGKALFCYWPPQHWGPVDGQQPLFNAGTLP